MKSWRSIALFAIFTLVVVVAITFIPKGEPESIISPLPVAPTKVDVEYRIEYGPEENRLTEWGATTLQVTSLGIGENGLPISWINPAETELILKLGEGRAALFIPSLGNLVTGFMHVKGEEYFHLMTVRIAKRSDGTMIVTAVPRS